MSPPLIDSRSITTQNYDVMSALSSVTNQAPVSENLVLGGGGRLVGEGGEGGRGGGGVGGHFSHHNDVNETGGRVFSSGTGTYDIAVVAVTEAISKGLTEVVGVVGSGDAADQVDENKNSHFFDTVDRNMTSEQWRNYSCVTSMLLPSGVFKEVIEPAICGSGIIGILLTMIVLSRKTMVTSTNCYLTALAVADLMYLLLLMSRIITDRIDDCDFQFGVPKSIYSHYTSIFMDVFCYTTIGVTVMLAVERYIAICQPMQAMTLCSVNRARIAIVTIAAVALILCSPKFFDMDITYVKVKSGKQLMVTWVSRYNQRVYVCVVQGLLVTVIPLVCLSALNLQLIFEIQRTTRYLQVCLGADWQTRSMVTREEVKITVMLVSVVVAFFVCQAPYMIYSLMIGLSNYELVNLKMLSASEWEIFQHVVQCMLAVKSSCNFILYCWFSEKFWITFKRLFCLSHCLPRQGTNRTNGCNTNNNSNNNHHRPSCYITRETTC